VGIVDHSSLIGTVLICKVLIITALSTTEIELPAIAADAMIGDSSMPKKGYRTPAVMGMPAVAL